MPNSIPEDEPMGGALNPSERTGTYVAFPGQTAEKVWMLVNKQVD